MTRTDGTVGRSPAVRVAAPPGDSRADEVLAAASEATDTVPVVRTGPVGHPGLEPLVLATRPGRTAFYGRADEATTRVAVEDLAAGDLAAGRADAVVDHDPGVGSLPVPTEGPLAVGHRRVLGPCGWVDPLAPADLALVAPTRDAGDVADLGLLGRGRGDATEDGPVADAWQRARETAGAPVVVGNANEADDRPRADRTLLGGAPIAVLDGLAAVAEHVGADDAVLVVNEADRDLFAHVRTAVEAAADDLPVVPQVVVGPDEFRAGEPTAALEALEGADRVEPRVQPPPPSEYGLYGRPTVVHTPRTLAQVRAALAGTTDGDEAASDPGTRLVTVGGDVAAPATVELASGDDLAVVREAVTVTDTFEMACVGGVFGGLAADLDVPATAAALEAAGLGTDGVVELLTDDRCPLAVAGERVRFAAQANSGRCVPGREGTTQLAELLRAVYDGSLRADDIRELGRTMARTSNCKVGARASRPATTALDAFGPTVRAHAEGRCPSGACEVDR